MKKLTNRKIKCLLSTGGTPEPPPGLAERIKAEIPEVLQLGGAGRSPEGVRGLPARSHVLRPLWLVAASLLLMIGAGFMVTRLLAPPEDLARRIALDGVTVIKDVVVTVPARRGVEKQEMAMSQSSGPAPAAGLRSAGSPASSVVVRLARNAPTPPPARGAEGQIAAVLPEKHASEEVTATDEHETISSENRGATGFAQRGNNKMVAAVAPVARAAFKEQMVGTAAPPTQAINGSIIVMVRDAAGKPVAGASVRLDLTDRRDVNCGSRETGIGGAATFCCVAPGPYRVCAQLPGFMAGTAEVVVNPGAQLTVPLTMNEPPADGKEHPWTCPSPSPAGKH
jgi:hypothetical protein